MVHAADDIDVVTVHVWRVPWRHVPAAMLAVATDRRRVRALSGVSFAKLLGTGRGFSPRYADLTRWVLVTSWTSQSAAQRFDGDAVATRWRGRSSEAWQAWLRPLSSRGRWSGRVPFGAAPDARWDGPVAAITRARLAPRRALSFWRAVPPVAAELAGRDGLLAAFGIGEAPLGVQGTFSLWSEAAAMRRFAHQTRAHRTAIWQTAERRWYAEELFARFGVLRTSGTLDGADPLNLDDPLVAS
jgi:hypothetical protein